MGTPFPGARSDLHNWVGFLIRNTVLNFKAIDSETLITAAASISRLECITCHISLYFFIKLVTYCSWFDLLRNSPATPVSYRSEISDYFLSYLAAAAAAPFGASLELTIISQTRYKSNSPCIIKRVEDMNLLGAGAFRLVVVVAVDWDRSYLSKSR